MKLSTKSEYGTRAMIDLALHSGSGPVLMKNISERQHIAFKYLGQLFLLLKNSGLIRGQRGSHGGYTLLRRPDNITLLQIFESLEGPLSLTDCVTDSTMCPNTENCVTREVWKKTHDLIKNFFAGITLKDLVDNYEKKRNAGCEMIQLKKFLSVENYEKNLS